MTFEAFTELTQVLVRASRYQRRAISHNDFPFSKKIRSRKWLYIVDIFRCNRRFVVRTLYPCTSPPMRFVEIPRTPYAHVFAL